MRFEWDAEKARRNLAKHGVSFEDAMLVWNDLHAEIVRDKSGSGEERYWAVGLTRSGVLIVVHLYPDPHHDELVRIISARKAKRHERRKYEDGDL